MTRETICPFDELVDGMARLAKVGTTPVAIVRIGDAVHAVHDTCTHADVSLSEGEVDPDLCTIECWKHGSTFSLVDGQPQSLPATRPVPVFAAGVDDGEVWVEVPTT